MLSGREVRTLVHDTLKSMLESKEGKRVQYLKDFDITIFDHITEIIYDGHPSEFPKNIDKLNNLISLTINSSTIEPIQLPQLPHLKTIIIEIFCESNVML